MFLFYLSICDFCSRGHVTFNTSHVLIYPFSQFNIVPLLQQFQYISCSYLSITYLHQSVRKPEFQYISCSYLSRGSNGWWLRRLSIHLMFLFIQGFKWAGWLRRHFNTSHVLIYPLVLGCVGIILANFNTSHVLIYLDLLLTRLMLTITFQYISCSYLSTTTSTCTLPTTISIHLMFLFIRVTELHLICNPLFQYISCSYLSWSMR